MNTSMRIALIADAFPPLRTSGAVQLRDLSLELVRQGHRPTVIIPAPELVDKCWLVEEMQGVEILRLKSIRTKDVGYIRRALAECLMPFAMLHNLRKSPIASVRWDGVVWYSPTIFLGPVAKELKKKSGCRSYLILRDIFPEWAVDMGLLSRGLPYRFFKLIERYQYSVADVIGVQTPANKAYFCSWEKQPQRKVEVLQNWLAEVPNVGCSISLADSPLAGRTIFVYAGNMGVAQGIGPLMDLAESLLERKDVGFLFVGRGRDAQPLREQAKVKGLSNVMFFDEIDPSEIPGLYAQCHVGIVALDPRHKTHNIPGKFLSYMQGGLPVLACINPGNDLNEIIENEQVGLACVDNRVEILKANAELLLQEVLKNEEQISMRCRNLSKKLFSPKAAVGQLIESLKSTL